MRGHAQTGTHDSSRRFPGYELGITSLNQESLISFNQQALIEENIWPMA